MFSNAILTLWLYQYFLWTFEDCEVLLPFLSSPTVVIASDNLSPLLNILNICFMLNISVIFGGKINREMSKSSMSNWPTWPTLSPVQGFIPECINILMPALVLELKFIMSWIVDIYGRELCTRELWTFSHVPVKQQQSTGPCKSSARMGKDIEVFEWQNEAVVRAGMDHVQKDWQHQCAPYPNPRPDLPACINSDLCASYRVGTVSSCPVCRYWGLHRGKGTNVPYPKETSSS